MLKFTEKTEKIKTKLLVLASISLFIAITESVPTKIAIIGLDLSNADSSIIPKFLFFGSLYFFIIFVFSTLLELTLYFLPFLIRCKNLKAKGEWLGLNKNEILDMEEQPHINEDADKDAGAIEGEKRTISKQEKKNKRTYNKRFRFILTTKTIALDCLFPFIYSAGSLILLWCFLF